MLTRILIVLSCNFAYWQYSDGTTSLINFNQCQVIAEHEAILERKRQVKAQKRALLLRSARLRARTELWLQRRPKCIPGHIDAASRLSGKCR